MMCQLPAKSNNERLTWGVNWNAVFFFISKSLLDDEWNPARLITFLTMKPQRQIH